MLRDELAALWTRAEAQRLTDEPRPPLGDVGFAGAGGLDREARVGRAEPARLRVLHGAARPGGHAVRRLRAADVQRSEDYRGPVQQRFLSCQPNTIEGGTSEVLGDILGERILGLPGDLRADSGKPWKEVPRG